MIHRFGYFSRPSLPSNVCAAGAQLQRLEPALAWPREIGQVARDLQCARQAQHMCGSSGRIGARVHAWCSHCTSTQKLLRD